VGIGRQAKGVSTGPPIEWSELGIGRHRDDFDRMTTMTM
jgi:hypothetical protein